MFKIRDVEIKNRIVLAPMAGITNEAFRILCKKYNAGLVYAEMVSSNGIDYNNDKTLGMLRVNPLEHPISMQIFGYDIPTMVKAAKAVDESDADIIDINMGCPVNKVIKAKAGSYLMTEPLHAYEMVSEIVKNVKKPVTVKFRSGFDFEHINAVEFAKLIEKAGASAIAIHARTKTQLYSGKADWDIIKKVKESVDIPVIGNGDIRSKDDAKRMLEYTKCDAIMVGRAVLGNPFLLNEIYEYIENGNVIKRPSLEVIRNTLYEHYYMLKKIKCEHIAVLEMRSQATYYVRGLKNNTYFKQRVTQVKTEEELFSLIDEYFLNYKEDSYEG